MMWAPSTKSFPSDSLTSTPVSLQSFLRAILSMFLVSFCANRSQVPGGAWMGARVVPDRREVDEGQVLLDRGDVLWNGG